MKSIGQILSDFSRKRGLQESQSALSDEELLCGALREVRPDLELFVKRVMRQGNQLVVEMAHPAAAQEGSMVAGDLVRALTRAAGARSVASVRFKA